MRAVYKATFNTYANAMKNSIHNPKTNTYRSVENGEKIILDTNIHKYMEFGNGFKTLEYIGDIAIEDLKAEDDTFFNSLDNLLKKLKEDDRAILDAVEMSNDDRESIIHILKKYYRGVL